MPSDISTVRHERRGRVLVVRIEREAKRNAIDRGHQLGFVNRVTEPGGALAAALELAEDVCASSPVSVAASLAAITAQHDAADATGWDLTARAVERVQASDDISEGVTAFFEKRQPRWTGH